MSVLMGGVGGMVYMDREYRNMYRILVGSSRD